MCAAAHGWVGLGRIVYASSAEQLGALPIGEVIKDTVVDGPDEEFSAQIHQLHIRRHATIADTPSGSRRTPNPVLFGN